MECEAATIQLLKTIREILSFNIRKLRGNRSMAEIAEAANIPFRTYQSIDMGKSWPQESNLMAIAKALGVHESRLFEDPDTQYKPSPEEAVKVLAALVESVKKK